MDVAICDFTHTLNMSAGETRFDICAAFRHYMEGYVTAKSYKRLVRNIDSLSYCERYSVKADGSMHAYYVRCPTAKKTFRGKTAALAWYRAYSSLKG